MTSDFGVTAGHVEYSNRRFGFDTRHMVVIEVYRHTAALDQFDYELPVYDRNEPYRARLYLSEDEFKTIRRMELNGVLRILHHANVVGGYLVDDRKPKRKNARKYKEESWIREALSGGYEFVVNLTPPKICLHSA